MKSWRLLMLGLLLAIGPATPSAAQTLAPEPDGEPAAASDSEPAAPAPPAEAAPASAATSPADTASPAPGVPDLRDTTPATEAAAALGRAIAALPPHQSDEERNERVAVTAFYTARANEPLFVTAKGLTPGAAIAVSEFENAAAWGLEPRDFALPKVAAAAETNPDLTPSQRAEAELKFALMVELYARYARGGRIINPAAQLNSNLDRRPQFAKPAEVIEGFAAAATGADAAVYLRGLHPQHAQFEKLRQRYLASKGSGRKPEKIADAADIAPGATSDQIPLVRRRLGLTPGTSPETTYDESLRAAVAFFQKDRGLKLSDGTIDNEARAALNKPEAADARRLLANMEEWRWMPANLGELYLIANVPEFMINLHDKSGAVLFTERIVAGEIGKQTSIFSRPLRHIVLRPMWRVPESIKVNELWPSLRRGGGLMKQYGLQLVTKDGKPLDWRAIDWNKDDIRNYDVTQPPGRISVLGHVKFSFPSPHTIYMHDTPDKWMFNSGQRTLSHGCLRLRNPMKLVEILLQQDKGWDRAHIDELSESGPLNNEVPMEKRIMMHLTYFTAWVADDGKLKLFGDIYGHEKRITQAIEGKWTQIAKGRDHLAPVQPNFSGKGSRVATQSRRKDQSAGDIIGSALGGLSF